MRKVNGTGFVGVVGWFIVSAVAAGAQDMPVGVWTGTGLNPGNGNRPVASLDIKKVPDPHWRWRGGPREILQATFAMANDRFDVGTVRLDGDTLAFTFINEERGAPVQCELKRLPEGSFEGQCAGQGFTRGVTLRPPEK